MHALFIFIFLVLYQVIALPAVPPKFPIDSRSLDDIYHAALKENGTLRVAWGGDIKASQEGIIHAFESQFPGIKLNLTVDLSKYWDSYIDRTHEVSNRKDDGVDVAVLQSLHDFPRWKEEGRLLDYKVAQWNDLYPQFVDRDGAYTGCYIFTFGDIVYGNDVATSTLPTTYPGFLDPKWSGKLSLTYPNDDDAILYLFTLITHKYGWGFINSLLKLSPQWVRGTATPSMLMSSTSSDSPSVSFASSSAFASGVNSTVPDDVYMAWPQTGAIFKTTKLPETSKLFMSFLLADQWQTLVGGSGFATRRSFDKKGVFEQKHMDPLGYSKFMADRRIVEAWRLQFESLLGLPQGEDPAHRIF